MKKIINITFLILTPVFQFNLANAEFEKECPIVYGIQDGRCLLNQKSKTIQNDLNTKIGQRKNLENELKIINQKISSSSNPYLATSSFAFVGKQDSKDNKQIEKLQSFLYPKYLTQKPTGYFGNATKKALLFFQKTNGLIETGKLDKQTIDFINKTYSK